MSFDEFIRVCEARQCKDLSRIADEIVARKNVRLVLLCGCSSAGKTTTAKRLCTALRVNNVECLHMSTDDYFKGHGHYPLNDDGTEDYEHVGCVDEVRLASDINRLIAGETIKRHVFDFVTKQPADTDESVTLVKGGIIVLEGIHALNPVLTKDIPDEVKYRIFIEPKTDNPALTRFLRRVVRDHNFRKTSADATYTIWPKVRAGETKWIEPYRKNADVEFDSGLPYELSVLKPYVLGPLEILKRKYPHDARLNFVVELLGEVEAHSPNAVPGDSILRETIGGSQLAY